MDLYPANNANDFQPTTQDPQSGVGTNLQTGAANLQPVPGSSGGQQSFPSAERLEVLGVDNPGTSASSANQTTTAPDNPFPYATITGLVLLVVFAVVLFWWALKAYSDADTFEEEAAAEPVPTPELKKAPAAVEQSKTTPKAKPAIKKKSSKKAKKRKKKAR